MCLFRGESITIPNQHIIKQGDLLGMSMPLIEDLSRGAPYPVNKCCCPHSGHVAGVIAETMYNKPSMV